jgi:DNA-binding FadR family transcriptional regulator
LEVFKEIKQTKPADAVYNQIKDAIFSHHYKSNEKLPSEKQLIEIFKVSRSAVREALKALELTGFIEVRQGASGGAFVNELTFEKLSSSCLDLFFANKVSLEEICDARIAIEPITTEMASQKLSDEDFQRIFDTVQGESLKGEYPIEVLSRSKLHYILAEKCGNKFLESMVKSLIVLTKEVSEGFSPHPDLVHPKGMHNKIIEALVNKKPKTAAVEMRKHLVQFKRNMKEAEESYRKTGSNQKITNNNAQ